MTRRLTATSILMALLIGLLALPAVAQATPPSPGAIVADDINALDCSLATALFFQEQIPGDEATVTLTALLPEPDEDGVYDVQGLSAAEQQALVTAAFEALTDIGQTFANVCSIYTPIVGGIVLEDEDPPVVEAVSDEEPTVVAADVLAVTGFNATLIAILGAVLLGLGFLAVRRTRDESPS